MSASAPPVTEAATAAPRVALGLARVPGLASSPADPETKIAWAASSSTSTRTVEAKLSAEPLFTRRENASVHTASGASGHIGAAVRELRPGVAQWARQRIAARASVERDGRPAVDLLIGHGVRERRGIHGHVHVRARARVQRAVAHHELHFVKTGHVGREARARRARIRKRRVALA